MPDKRFVMTMPMIAVYRSTKLLRLLEKSGSVVEPRPLGLRQKRIIRK
jgi:hypothetical protein